MTLLNRLNAAITGLIIACLLLAAMALPGGTGTAAAAQDGQYLISRVAATQTSEGFQLVITGKNTPTYTMYELFDPLRIVLDVADARLDPAALPSSLPEGPVQVIRSVVLDEQKPPIVRLEIQMADDRAYTVERRGSNIVVSFAKTTGPLEQPVTVGSKKAAPPAKSTVPPQSVQATTLNDIEVDTNNPGETLVFLKTGLPVPSFKKAHLGKSGNLPDRMYIDLPSATLPGKALQLNVGTALARVRAAQRNDGVRIVFDSGLPELFPYEMEARPDGLMVKIAEPLPATPILAGLMARNEKPAEETRAAEPPAQAVAPSLPTAKELIAPQIPTTVARAKVEPARESAPARAMTPVPKPAGKKSAAKTPADTLGFAGYEKQRITVDFFKIDLHNVFRLFGEISGQNIVVDEAVQGTLTLALNEVPWDFALDIIINLKDLQKEERFNTIVISPKAKQFVWPKGASDSIAFKADQDAISVEQRLETPGEVIEARRLIKEAAVAEKSGQHEKALALYEAAFAGWPDNAQLASRLASLSLVRFGLNAKALHYAKAALGLEPNNATAALQAAIASANMKKIDEAKKFFDRAINIGTPSSEALISYASFAEEYESYNGALALLGKHEELHGDTLDTLVSKARILDKAGRDEEAVKTYHAVLLSGYDVPEDLRRFIEGRVAAAR